MNALKPRKAFIQDELNIERLTRIQFDGIIRAMDKYAKHYYETVQANEFEKPQEHSKFETKVKHSESKNAWNIIGVTFLSKYKIAIVPYNQLESKDSEIYNTQEKSKALEHAMFISYCFNNNFTIKT